MSRIHCHASSSPPGGVDCRSYLLSQRRNASSPVLLGITNGSVADVAVLSLQKGRFGFTDMVNGKVEGTQKLVAELTLKDGKIVYDLNGLESLAWDAPQGDTSQDKRWTSWPRPVPQTH